MRTWFDQRLRPGAERALEAVGGIGSPIQAYCDLLEVRWLLSEQAGRDVGDAVALAALADRAVPPESAARMAVAEAPTGTIPVIGDLDELDTPAELSELSELSELD